MVGFARDLIDPAVVAGATTTADLYAVDCDGESPSAVYVLVPEAGGFAPRRRCRSTAAPTAPRDDLTRAIRTIPAGRARARRFPTRRAS